MDLQRISVPLKNIANVSKRNGNALQRIALQRKNASTIFSLSLVFPNRLTIQRNLSTKSLIHYKTAGSSIIPVHLSRKYSLVALKAII